jgi:hypothetical protein
MFNLIKFFKKKENKIVIMAVVMRRYGHKNGDHHSYLLGVWFNKPYSFIYKEAIKEKRSRGNKYEPEFCIIDNNTGYVKEKWMK